MRLGTTLAFTPLRKKSAKLTPLRVAEVQGRMFNGYNTLNSINDSMLIRMPFAIGQDMKDILLSFMNWYHTATAEVNNGNAFTIVSCSIESLSGVVTPVKFSGATSILVPDGANDLQSDIIYPSAFGLSKFTRGEQYWIKAILLAGTNTTLPKSPKIVTAFSGSQTSLYSSSATTISSTYVSGAYTSTGTTPQASANGYQPIVLGHPVVDGPSFFAIGDSIGEGAGDTTAANLYGHGFIQRAIGNGGVQPFPCLNFCRSSLTSDHGVAGLKWRAYAQYARYAIDQYGTNDIVVSAKTVTAIQASLTNLWGLIKANGIQGIIKSGLICSTNSTDGWLTAINQTARSGWTAGDKSDQLNAWFLTKVSDGTLTASASYPAVRDSGAPNKWISDNATTNYMTADGLHPSPAAHALIGASLRSVITSLT